MLNNQSNINPLVAGISLNMNVGTKDTLSIIGGPAIYAALGVHSTGLKPRLMTAVGNDLSDNDRTLLNIFGFGSAPTIKEMQWPMISWRSNPVLGSTGRGQLSDDPTRWRVMPERNDIDGQPLILANGDPAWYADILTSFQPSLVVIDIHSEWMHMRVPELNICLSKADIVTMTEHEYKLLPKNTLSGCLFGQKNKILILKNGTSGVSILVDGQTKKLPPPTPAFVNTDVGCGDLLLGAIAGHYITENLTNPTSSVSDKIERAYLQSLELLTLLLESVSPYHFIMGLLKRR